MTPSNATTAPNLAEAVQAKLQDAAHPLKMTDVIKGLPKPRKTSKPQFIEEVRTLLDEDVRLGRAFSQPSGKNAEPRYWSRDEKHLLREKALELASEPKAVAVLKKGLIKEIKGTDAAFVESVVREMISDGSLYEHPAKRGTAMFARTPPSPPPPVLDKPAYRKSLTTIAASCHKLLDRAGVSVETLLDALRGRLLEPASPRTTATEASQNEMSPPLSDSIEDVILKAVANEAVLSLADLRREMPNEFRGPAFDEAVLRLVDAGKIIVTQDADPSGFTPEQRQEYVQDGDKFYTNVMKRS